MHNTTLTQNSNSAGAPLAAELNYRNYLYTTVHGVWSACARPLSNLWRVAEAYNILTGRDERAGRRVSRTQLRTQHDYMQSMHTKRIHVMPVLQRQCTHRVRRSGVAFLLRWHWRMEVSGMLRRIVFPVAVARAPEWKVRWAKRSAHCSDHMGAQHARV